MQGLKVLSTARISKIETILLSDILNRKGELHPEDNYRLSLRLNDYMEFKRNAVEGLL